MKTYNVLVTGVGAIIGYGIINALRKSKYKVKIFGIDIFDDAIGKNYCDVAIQGVLASSEGYIEFLKKTIDEYAIDLVIPGIEQDIYRMISDDLPNKYKSKIVLNNEKLIQIAKDKWILHEHLVQSNMKHMNTMISDDYKDLCKCLGLPFLQKPRTSYASKGIVTINNYNDFEYWRANATSPILYQEIIGNTQEEYTVGLFGFGDGTILDAVMMLQRTLNKEGSTGKAKVVNIEHLHDEVKALAKYFKPLGPTNMQFRKHHDDFLLLEINPRCSSSVSIRCAFGYNDAEMCIEYFLEKTTPSIPTIQQGCAQRYLEDYIKYQIC